MVTKKCQTVTFMLVLLIGILGFSGFAFAADSPDIRVQLQANVNSAQVAIVTGEYKVVNVATGKSIGVVKAGSSCSVIREGSNLKIQGISGKNTVAHNGSVRLEAKDPNYCLFSINNVTYRGSLTLHNTDRGLVVVNSLPVEAYLYGVVGPEMGSGAPEEALKSQAVASRSYAMQKQGLGLYSDLTLWSQVYKGYDAELMPGFDKVKSAVDSTKGQVATYEDAVIDAVFHSNSGGFTESSENVWQSSVPYLRAVTSQTDSHAQSVASQNATGWPANCYQWSVTLTRDQLNKCVTNWNASRPNDVINIGKITNIKLSRADTSTGDKNESGRVTAMTLVGTQGEKVITKDAIRSFFKVDGSILRSTLFDIAFNPNFGSITINGRGNGHGLGMSQWGARGMAADHDANYEDIIRHYYSGVEIKTLY